MADETKLGGNYMFAGTSLRVNRIGYGAMQLAGPGVFGPPADRAGAVAVLREAVAQGVNHIDTSDFYGPHVTNEIIREALHPYPEGLVIVTKVGFRRGHAGSWLPALTPDQLRMAVEDNLRNLGLEAMDVVNLRLGDAHGPAEKSLAEPLGTLLEMKQQGKIRAIGLSNITPKQYAEGRGMTEIACVQNLYNLANRADDDFIDRLNEDDVPYVPYFPLGGFTPLQGAELDAAAESVGATPMQVALAWLLQRSPNLLLIPGTKSVVHLKENLQIASLELSPLVLAALDAVASAKA
jgi:pyridoxine 4-dehydrogenase